MDGAARPQFGIDLREMVAGPVYEFRNGWVVRSAQADDLCDGCN